MSLVVLAVAVVLGSTLGGLELVAWIVIGGPAGWLGVDGARLIEASARLGDELYANPDFLYSPLAAVLALPALVLPLGLPFGIAKVVGVALFSAHVAALRGPVVRALTVLGAALCVAVAQDVVLGNVNVPLTLGLALVIWSDKPAVAVTLGVLLAAFPKPHLVPIILWIAWWRPSSAAWALAAAAIATAGGILVAGADAYLEWPGVLMAGRRFMSPLDWNVGVSRFLPDLAPAVGVAAMAVAVIGIVAFGPGGGLRVAAFSTLLVAPYLGSALTVPLLLIGWSAIRPPAVGTQPMGARAGAWLLLAVRRARARLGSRPIGGVAVRRGLQVEEALTGVSSRPS